MAKILIVDDSDILRIELREALKSGGHTVVQAVDGADGLAKAAVDPDIDLVIADYNMPLMDGLTMVHHIRNLPGRERVRFFIHTQETSSQLKKVGKELGVSAWLIKPFHKDRLLEAIDTILAKRPTS